jgi:predicted urease superfamily metal-dependent hydrolase
MSKLKLLILDANVVIHLHEFGIWAKLIAALKRKGIPTIAVVSHHEESVANKNDFLPAITKKRREFQAAVVSETLRLRFRGGC